MTRPYEGHYLNEEQKKLAADNINLVWWYIDKKLLRYNKIEPKEIDDVAGYLMWQLCMAAEGFDPKMGYKFSTYAKVALNGGIYRYKQLQLPYEQRYILTDFSPPSNSNGDGSYIDEPKCHPQEAKFVDWDDISWLFDLIDTTLLEKQIIRFHYELRYNLEEISKVTNLSRERIRQINDSFAERIRKEISEEIQMEDFYVEKY